MPQLGFVQHGPVAPFRHPSGPLSAPTRSCHYSLGVESPKGDRSEYPARAPTLAVQRFCNALSISAGTPPSSRDDFTGRPMRHGITIGMDGKGRCIDNIFVERLWRSRKYEEVHRHAHTSVADARAGIGAVGDVAGGQDAVPHRHEEPASYSAGRDRQTTPPLAGPHRGNRRQLRRAHWTASPGLLILRQEK